MLFQTFITLFAAASATAHPLEQDVSLDSRQTLSLDVLGLAHLGVDLGTLLGAPCPNQCGDKCLPEGQTCCGGDSGFGCNAGTECHCASQAPLLWICLDLNAGILARNDD